MKSSVFFTLLLGCLSFASSGCAQDSIPAPRALEGGATITQPTVVTDSTAPAVALPIHPRPLHPPTPDPDLAGINFEPGNKTLYSSVLVRGPYIAMTFDDGPSPDFTPSLLDQLKVRGIKATFFVVGQNVAAYPQIAKRIVTEGHEIANHSWSHPAFAKMSNVAVSSQIERTEDAIFAATGVRSLHFRPPYGSITAAQKKWIPEKYKLKIILWSLDPLDWKKPGDAVLQSRIVNGAHPGAIILAHDIHGTTVRAMPATFDQLLAKGYKFVTVSELLALEVPPTPVTPRPVTEPPTAAPTAPEPTPEIPALPAAVQNAPQTAPSRS